MLQQHTEAPTSVKSLGTAEQATIRTLLNSFFREMGEPDPRIEKVAQQAPRTAQGETFAFQLPLSGKTLMGTMTYFSAVGQHVYGPFFFVVPPEGTRQELDMHQLIALLLDELSGRVASDNSGVLKSQMKMRIENSIEKMGLYVEHYRNRLQWERQGKLDFVGSEQSLYLGHPFHPYPKCSEGFVDDDLARYSPEMRAAFPLHYFAVKKDYVYEEWLKGQEQVPPPSVVTYAEERLGEQAGEYVLLPMHPWQARYLAQRQEVQHWMKQEAIISLGSQGPIVYPTSSVRTVWEPVSGCGYKLPLHVRITNLIRDNTVEQAKRTMDAASVLHQCRHELQTEYFQILMETGFRSVRFPQMPEELAASFTVIYRPMAINSEHTFVLASLLETLPDEAEPKLIQAIRQSSPGRMPEMGDWLERYLHISMLPFLRMLAGKGISFEAHLQNSLLSIKDGFPDCYYVRDLEGVSIDRVKAAEAGWIGTLMADDSPVLYQEAEAWKRTKYYFFVNHLGSLIHTIAAHQQEGEERYWRIVRALLLQEKEGACERLLAYIDDLLHSEHLPAKANFTSCFLARGETPLFIQIPNPIKGVP